MPRATRFRRTIGVFPMTSRMLLCHMEIKREARSQKPEARSGNPRGFSLLASGFWLLASGPIIHDDVTSISSTRLSILLNVSTAVAIGRLLM